MKNLEENSYAACLALFQENALILSDGMQISLEAEQGLSQIIDTAMSSDFALLPGGSAVEVTNREAIVEQRVPYVRILTDNGTLTLPACELKLLSFDEMVGRLQPDMEAFQLFLFSQNVLVDYLRNLSLWRNVDAELVAQYRSWLRGDVDQAEHQKKLKAVVIYCQLAQQSGFLSSEELESIVKAVEKPLSWRSRTKKRHIT